MPTLCDKMPIPPPYPYHFNPLILPIFRNNVTLLIFQTPYYQLFIIFVWRDINFQLSYARDLTPVISILGYCVVYIGIVVRAKAWLLFFLLTKFARPEINDYICNRTIISWFGRYKGKYTCYCPKDEGWRYVSSNDFRDYRAIRRRYWGIVNISIFPSNLFFI